MKQVGGVDKREPCPVPLCFCVLKRWTPSTIILLISEHKTVTKHMTYSVATMSQCERLRRHLVTVPSDFLRAKLTDLPEFLNPLHKNLWIPLRD